MPLVSPCTSPFLTRMCCASDAKAVVILGTYVYFIETYIRSGKLHPVRYITTKMHVRINADVASDDWNSPLCVIFFHPYCQDFLMVRWVWKWHPDHDETREQGLLGHLVPQIYWFNSFAFKHLLSFFLYEELGGDSSCWRRSPCRRPWSLLQLMSKWSLSEKEKQHLTIYTLCRLPNSQWNLWIQNSSMHTFRGM